MVRHDRLHVLPLVQTDVGRIAENHIERFVAFGIRLQHVAVKKTDVGVQGFCVFTRHGKCLIGDVPRSHVCRGEAEFQTARHTAGTRPGIQDPQRAAALQRHAFQSTGGKLHELLRLGARDEHGGTDAKGVPAEMSRAEHVLDRFAGNKATKHSLKTQSLIFRKCPNFVGVNIGSTHTEAFFQDKEGNGFRLTGSVQGQQCITKCLIELIHVLSEKFRWQTKARHKHT